MALSGHPVALARPALDAAGGLPLSALTWERAGASVVVAGRVVLIRSARAHAPARVDRRGPGPIHAAARCRRSAGHDAATVAAALSGAGRDAASLVPMEGFNSDNPVWQPIVAIHNARRVPERMPIG